MNIAIYGAQGIAYSVYLSLKKISPVEISCFVVTSKENNAGSICGIPVKEIELFSSELTQEDKDRTKVLIATPENTMDEIESTLKNHGFYHYVRVTSHRWSEMQRDAFMQNEEIRPLEIYPIGSDNAKVHIYKAMFYKDKKLSDSVRDTGNVTPIQVGAAQTDIRVADVLDCYGDNISEKNGNYSELTGLYWIWKNRVKSKYYGDECYYGLVHYRRIFELSDDDLLRLRDNDIDVVLPYPMPYSPNIEEHHKRYLASSEWNAVVQALTALYPEYLKEFKSIMGQEYFYNYNIILAKDTVLDEYCNWLFPILFLVEKLNDPDDKKKPNRYLGYVGETLETLYFMYNRKKLRIAHAGYRFIK